MRSIILNKVIRNATKPTNEYSALQRANNEGVYPTIPVYAQPGDEWTDCPNTYEQPNSDGENTYGLPDLGTYVHTDGIDDDDEGEDTVPDVPPRQMKLTSHSNPRDSVYSRLCV